MKFLLISVACNSGMGFASFKKIFEMCSCLVEHIGILSYPSETATKRATVVASKLEDLMSILYPTSFALTDCDISLIPFGDGQFTFGRIPGKVLDEEWEEDYSNMDTHL